MKLILALITVILLAGCGKVEERYIYLKTTCPKFNYKTDGIEFHDYNATHATISHEDIKDIAKFAKERDDFNKYVEKLNKEK